MKKTPDEWLTVREFKGTVVREPYGWDRTNFKEDWAIPLTHTEFMRKLINSTYSVGPHFWDKKSSAFM
jgi:hypothetical protein